MLKEREDFYINLIKNSYSLREVCLRANICATTGNYDTLKNIISNNNIDISHFKRNCGERNNLKINIKIEDYLNNKFSISAFKLKNKLIKLGIKEHKCECCGLTEWLGKTINLELHHIDGNNKNNNLDNLQILCPNCHSCTDNFGGKNQKLNIKKHYCIQCGKEIHNKKSSLCSKECRDKYLYNAEPLTIEKVVNVMKTVYNKRELAIKLNRGYKTVNKFIKENGIEYRFKNDNIKNL